jgi:hypothetical protein
VTVGHHLLAHAEPLLRDAERVRHAYEAAGLCCRRPPAPRGPRFHCSETGAELGSERLTANSMDAWPIATLRWTSSTRARRRRSSQPAGRGRRIWRAPGWLLARRRVSTGSASCPRKKTRDIGALRGPLRPHRSSLVSPTISRAYPSRTRDLQGRTAGSLRGGRQRWTLDAASRWCSTSSSITNGWNGDQRPGSSPRTRRRQVAAGVPLQGAETKGQQVRDQASRPWSRVSIARRLRRATPRGVAARACPRAGRPAPLGEGPPDSELGFDS